MSVLKDVETRLEGLIEYDDLGIDSRVEGSSGFNEDLFDDIPCVVDYVNKKLKDTA